MLHHSLTHSDTNIKLEKQNIFHKKTVLEIENGMKNSIKMSRKNACMLRINLKKLNKNRLLETEKSVFRKSRKSTETIVLKKKINSLAKKVRNLLNIPIVHYCEERN